MGVRIDLTGTSGKEYNLEELSTKNVRTDSSKSLKVQVWRWNPNGLEEFANNPEEFEAHKYPNPPNPELGQIWLSKLIK